MTRDHNSVFRVAALYPEGPKSSPQHLLLKGFRLLGWERHLSARVSVEQYVVENAGLDGSVV